MKDPQEAAREQAAIDADVARQEREILEGKPGAATPRGVFNAHPGLAPRKMVQVMRRSHCPKCGTRFKRLREKVIPVNEQGEPTGKARKAKFTICTRCTGRDK